MSDPIADDKKKVWHTPTYEVNVHEPTSGGILYRIVEIGERKQIIGKFFSREKAEFFVRAVNAHEALLEAAKNILEILRMTGGTSKPIQFSMRLLDKAIARAEREGGKP